MAECFVMQPFDGGKFDKRFADTFAPAIRKAELEPYRVDKDHNVSIPINEIEEGIRRASVCFAEITLDNPNVWFELGYAIALRKDVVLVCSEERTGHLPFDVQHHKIIRYKTDSPQDFEELGAAITERISAILKKQETVGRAVSVSPVKETEGLDQQEIVALVTVAETAILSYGKASVFGITQDMEKLGFTKIAVAIALTTLENKAMVEVSTEDDGYGGPHTSYNPTQAGLNWLVTNKDRLVLKREEPPTFSGTELPF